MIGLYFDSFELFVDWNFAQVTIAKNLFFYSVCMGKQGTPFFFINNPFLTLVPKIVYVFLKNHPEKLFSNCLLDGLLTSIVEIFKDSKRPHSLLQGHLEYLMHTSELTSPKVSISLRFPMHKKDFSLFSQWIV